MIRPTKDQHKLILPVLNLTNLKFRALLFKQIGVNQAGLMPQMLRAFRKVLREVFPGHLLQQLTLMRWNTVPQLALALMKIVYGGQVQVLFVPCEEGFPTTDVDVWGAYSFAVVTD